MKSYKYLVIGGGMTADCAVKAIRELDRNGSAALVSSEIHPPYDRPPLSKGLWKGKHEDTIWRTTTDQDVDVYLGRTIRTVSAGEKNVTDDYGETYSYEKLLLATGCEPRRLPFGGNDVIYFRAFEDYRRLRALTLDGKVFVVIGGGFIGSEIAAALAMNGKQVVMIFPEHAIGARAFPSDLAQFINRFYQAHEIQVLAGGSVSALRWDGTRTVVRTGSGSDIPCDGVVAGIGVSPRTELAAGAGVKLDDGIRVDEFLRTSAADIYAAGDVASFYNPLLEKRIRVEHEDNANSMGRAAGRAMAGEAEPYHHLPSFYSDLFDLGYEAVGEIDSRFETFSDWTEQYRKGVVYYLRDSRLRGVLLWNVWERVDAARALLREKREFRGSDLKGRITS
jgi:NADPH-dependent 2,4-dienoyl-CoA reductase/sulfur reductase-like enzyme